MSRFENYFKMVLNEISYFYSEYTNVRMNRLIIIRNHEKFVKPYLEVFY